MSGVLLKQDTVQRIRTEGQGQLPVITDRHTQALKQIGPADAGGSDGTWKASVCSQKFATRYVNFSSNWVKPE